MNTATLVIMILIWKFTVAKSLMQLLQWLRNNFDMQWKRNSNADCWWVLRKKKALEPRRYWKDIEVTVPEENENYDLPGIYVELNTHANFRVRVFTILDAVFRIDKALRHIARFRINDRRDVSPQSEQTRLRLQMPVEYYWLIIAKVRSTVLVNVQVKVQDCINAAK